MSEFDREALFVSKIIQTQKVWGLKSNAGFATLASNEFENEEGQPIPIVCFWSDKKSAVTVKKKHWKNFVPVEISISEFLEKWCVGVYNDELLIGTNIDLKLARLESEPLPLAIKILEGLKNTGA